MKVFDSCVVFLAGNKDGPWFEKTPSVGFQKGEKHLGSTRDDTKVNVRSRQRRLTPLHVAAAQGSVDLVEHLLAANADVLCQTEDHQIALHYAAANGHAEVVQVLVHQDSSQLTLRNIFGQRPMEAAANASTAFIFRAFESTESLRKATVSTASTTLGSRRSSVCSDASTATGSSDVMEMKLEVSQAGKVGPVETWKNRTFWAQQHWSRYN